MRSKCYLHTEILTRGILSMLCDCEIISSGSVIFYYNEGQRKAAEETKAHFNELLRKRGMPETVTEIQPAKPYYFAEEYRKYCQENEVFVGTVLGPL